MINTLNSVPSCRNLSVFFCVRDCLRDLTYHIILSLNLAEIMASEEERGAQPKERPCRVRPSIDYKMLHEGAGLEEGNPGCINETVSVSSLSPPRDIPDGDLGHKDAAQSLLDLDQEIKALETSIREVNSQLKPLPCRRSTNSELIDS